MKNIKWIYVLTILISLISCKENERKEPNLETEKNPKTIKIVAQQRPFGEPLEFDMEVKNALENLQYANEEDVKIDSLDLVIGIPLKNTQIAIPLSYMSAFEVANFKVESNHLSITWCPIVGTARVFENDNNTSGFDFGYGLNNNNLLVVDRKTNTVWNQLSGNGILGELKGDKLKSVSTIQSTWSFWKNKYPNTKILINKDTTNAVFPQFLDEIPHYINWKPGDGRPKYEDFHQIETLGLGIDLGNSSIYFPFEILFKENSPVNYELEGFKFNVHFDESGLTAWAENINGKMIPSAIAYNWAWKNFYPESKIFKK
ncbi:DUF3179 domain-containing protein [Tamlana fucoidanivorans]|uniref:DUF3179 domain-containing protein n=1 Tax=Allotamlana fucoidanivorans TaxID=2583814 RepID=A0A5C4SD77_9FLAO|nr:DUF3179 domain-containing (seleno)protein [Tamlana fucoidanivorans]TNJ40913.1 DUF3179 domain-containing protein [Tamlana fucoidanivorans]